VTTEAQTESESVLSETQTTQENTLRKTAREIEIDLMNEVLTGLSESVTSRENVDDTTSKEDEGKPKSVIVLEKSQTEMLS
jgi:hypothetical protein